MQDKALKTIDDVKKALKDLDVSYYLGNYSEDDYESMKQDLYVYLHKLEKKDMKIQKRILEIEACDASTKKWVNLFSK